MPIIFCSSKLSDFLELKEIITPTENKLDDKYGNWNAQLFSFMGNKCMIFANKKTLYSFVIMNIITNDFKEKGLLISSFLNQLKADNLYNINDFDFWADYFSDLRFSKPDNDEDLIGFVNNMILQLKGGLENDIPPFKNRTHNTIATNLNVLQIARLDFKTPIEAFSEI